MSVILSSVKEKFLDLLFPKVCLGCQKPGTFLCPAFEKKITYTTVFLCPVCEKPSLYGLTHPGCKTNNSLDGMIVLGHYGGVLRTAIHFLKYKNIQSLAPLLSDLFIKHLPSWHPSFDLITPIPLHEKRLRVRGYNQAALLAENISLKNKWTYRDKILIRIKNTISQMSIKDIKERKKNLHNAFILSGQTEINGKIIGLVDDVATSGTTINEAAEVLKQNGAKSVWGIVLARKISNSRIVSQQTAR